MGYVRTEDDWSKLRDCMFMNYGLVLGAIDRLLEDGKYDEAKEAIRACWKTNDDINKNIRIGMKE